MEEQTAMLLQQFLKEYAWRLQERTLIAYEYNIQTFFTFAETSHINTKAGSIRAWMSCLQNRGQKPTTIHQKIAALRLFFSYLVEEQLLDTNPVKKVELLKLEEKIPSYLSLHQLHQLRNLVKDSPRERAIIETLYSTGVRVGELADMKQTDVSWEERSIKIRNGKGKKERLVFFSRACEEALKVYLDTRQESHPNLLLNKRGNPLQNRALGHNFDDYSETLGFKMTPHTMRHTFAAHLAEKGMPLVYIQDLLGHDTIEVTKIYAKLFEKARKDIYDYYL